jgi:hypothetical protein
MAGVTWVIDSSSFMDIKSKTSIEVRAKLYASLTHGSRTKAESDCRVRWSMR